MVETLAVDALFYVRRARGLASACGWFSIQAIEFSPVEPAAMPLFARKKKEPKEELRNSQREVNRSTRALDSDIRDLEREEASLIVKLKRKESLSKNEVRWSGGGGGGVGGRVHGEWGLGRLDMQIKLHAVNLVRVRKSIADLKKKKGQLQGLNTQTAITHASMRSAQVRTSIERERERERRYVLHFVAALADHRQGLGDRRFGYESDEQAS